MFKEIVKRIGQLESTTNKTQIAKAIGISSQNLSNYEGRGNIPAKEILAYANTKNVNLNWIFRGEGNPYADGKSINGINNINGTQTITIKIGEHGKTEIREIAEIVKILEGLPEKSIKKLYHLAELERLESEK